MVIVRSKDETSDQPDFDMVNFGACLRQIRMMRKFSLVELSERSSVSVAMLSHIERGQAAPSFKTLQKISAGLSVPLSDIFLALEREHSPAESIVVRNNNRLRIQVNLSGVHKELLSPPRDSELEMLVLVLPPGSNSGEAPWVGQGDKGGSVLSGRFRLIVGEESYDLEVGDSFQFDGSIPHKFENLSLGESRVMWIIKARTM